MKTYIVQLEPHDDVISTRDKISWSKAARVLLVWPQRGNLLERQVDLLLLQRHARKLGAQLGLVTHSGVVKDHAVELGIPVFESAVQAQREKWRRPRRTTRRPRIRRMHKAQDPQLLRSARVAFRSPAAANVWLRLAVFLTGILAFLALALFFLPGARVEFTPIRENQQLQIDLWASPSITAPNRSGGLPARPVTVVVEGRDQVESSGTAYIPNQAAAGEVQLTNLSDQAVEVPKGSAVRTIGVHSVRYLTTRTARLAAGPGTTADVPVEALLPGRIGNLAAGQVLAVEGPLGLRLTAENPAAIGGGLDRTGPAPSAADYRTLKQKLLERLQDTALQEIEDQVAEGQRLLDGTLRAKTIVEENTEPAINQPGDQLQLTLRVEFEAWVVAEADLQAVAQAALDANLREGYRPVAGSTRVQFLEAAQREDRPLLDTPAASATAKEGAALDRNDTQETVRWPVQVDRVIAAELAEGPALRAVLGQPVESAELALKERLPLASTPGIQVFPSWWQRLPFLHFRVDVVIAEEGVSP